jgi:beta-glucosidase
MAGSWNPELVRAVAEAIGKETSARGIHQALSPTINIARDQRCGRVQETFGEDPLLAAKMTVAFITGLQSQKVIATPKHFVANFVGDGGRDSNDVHISERLLREIYFPAFRAAVREAGALSLMTSYNSVDGIPASCHPWLLTEVLRKEWGFKGYVVSDYSSVEHIHTKHHVAPTLARAAKLALEAGLEMELPVSQCFEELPTLLREGELSEEVIDRAVGRILYCKFWLGLFDDPEVDPDFAEKICDCEDHRQLALQIARESMVLLKNQGGVLPLKKKLRALAVVGPNAAAVRLGGYTGFGMKVVTPLEGIRAKLAPQGTEVHYAEGCDIKGSSREGFEAAVQAAERSDAVLVFGGSRMGVEGEGQDRSRLDLLGVQEDLIERLCDTGKPVIVVLIAGRATTMNKWIDRIQGLLCAWYPGEEGGNAVADVLFGDYNPGGKLPITFALNTGQLPLYYNPKPTGRKFRYLDLEAGEPQVRFPFGFGLSYTEFRYSNLRINEAESQVEIGLDIENLGKAKGEEVVQLYIRDETASVARPIKELKGFRRIQVDPGEKKTVEFVLGPEDLSFLDGKMHWVVEPGDFAVMVGSSSEDIRLTGTFTIGPG